MSNVHTLVISGFDLTNYVCEKCNPALLGLLSSLTKLVDSERQCFLFCFFVFFGKGDGGERDNEEVCLFSGLVTLKRKVKL